jgi:hypothetical protein
VRLESVRMRPRLLSVVGALLLGVGGAAGCGSSSSSNGVAAKTPEQILTAAKAAADGAASVHLAGSIVSEGKPISIDMQLLAGKGGKGRITLEGLAIRLIRVEQAIYIGGSAAFYRHIAGAAAAQLLQGKWLKAPENGGNFSSLASLTELGKLIDTALAEHGSLRKGATTSVAGHQVVPLEDVANGGTLYVAASGTPYPVEIVKKGGSGGSILFNNWNQPVTLTAPANAININQLQSGH